jgi:heat shock protein 4
VAKECTEAKAWLADKMAQQAALAKHAPLAVLTKEITARTATVERFCKPVMSKPRPAPVEPVAEVPAANGEAPMDTDAPAAEEAAPMQADLD